MRSDNVELRIEAPDSQIGNFICHTPQAVPDFVPTVPQILEKDLTSANYLEIKKANEINK